jgi:hypothetical protein
MQVFLGRESESCQRFLSIKFEMEEEAVAAEKRTSA